MFRNTYVIISQFAQFKYISRGYYLNGRKFQQNMKSKALERNSPL